MNRRDFVKLLSVSAASTAAAGTLVSIPAAEKKIELLQPQKIIKLEDDEIYIANNIIRFSLNHDGNFTDYYDSHRIVPGTIRETITATIYLNGVDGHGALAEDIYRTKFFSDHQVIKFDFPQLQGRKYILTEWTISAEVGDFIEAEITAMRIA